MAMLLTKLSSLLPLPSEELQQVLDYAGTLSQDEATSHFQNLLGNSPKVKEFITSFNSQRQSSQERPNPRLPDTKAKKSKKKTSLHTSAQRREVIDGPLTGTAYQKKDEDNYMVTTKRLTGEKSNDVATPVKSSHRPPPSAAGTLISDFVDKQTKSSSVITKKSAKSSLSKPINQTKIKISGGKSLHGASTIISELDAAIRSLEISTNSKLDSQDSSSRACNCIATRHPILEAAPNCQSCGKVICVVEGLGPCTFCGTPLLSPVEVQTMISHLRVERGREKMLADNETQKRPEVASTPRPFSTPKEQNSTSRNPENPLSSAELEARAHRDKLLNFQAQNASRTTVRDEVADFNTDEAEVRRDMIWASPIERAKALKKQQKLLQEMQWQARPEYEQRRVMVSLDVVDGKVVKRFRNQEIPREDNNPKYEKLSTELDLENEVEGETLNQNGAGTFRKNPLLGNLIRPIWSAKLSHSAEKAIEKGVAENRNESRLKIQTWRRVQDEQEDNEDVILDGGLYGG